MITPKALATDLDGTFIPLGGHPENVFALLAIERALQDDSFQLAFVTGRHLELTLDAIRAHALPTPHVLIADVGTSIYLRDDERGWQPSEEYAAALSAIASPETLSRLGTELVASEELRLQEPEKQGPFKLSFYCDEAELPRIADAIRSRLRRDGHACDVVDSIDPFNGDGLIDVVPRNASKAFAIDWWRRFHDLQPEEIVFAGDSGNDLAALIAGYRAIVVGNASDQIRRDVIRHHEQSGWNDRLHLATEHATSGVLAGARHFGLIDEASPLGASYSEGRAAFAVWAPHHKQVDVVIDECGQQFSHRLTRQGDVHSGRFSVASADVVYGFRINGGPIRPDPRSRFQPKGVHGLSGIVPESDFAWTDHEWRGISREDLVIYEIHIGTLTVEGTFGSAIEALDELVELGVTAIELMPVAACPGKWNWGYDGVHLFAPSANYGTPDELRMLVDAAHQRGLAVILDVVYNHLGPERNYLAEFGPYFSSRHQTPWGDGLNFDGSDSHAVRDFFIDNALYWLDEFHLDGLRLDAVHAIVDDSHRHILKQIRRAVTAYSSVVRREIHLIAESNLYDEELLKGDAEVAAYDLIWCDDLMHAVYSHLVPDARHTQRPYDGFSDVVECLRRGYLYSGLPETRAGNQTPDVVREPLVIALQNHDVVGNDPHGRRFHHLTSVDVQRAVLPLFLLQPSIPLLFMGEEFASDSPFHFFVDFSDEHVRAGVEAGRAREYPTVSGENVVLPTSIRAFEESRLKRSDRAMRDWYQQVIRLRRRMVEDGVLKTQNLLVEVNPGVAAIKLIYRPPAGKPDYFVLVRMDMADVARPVRVVIEGAVLADSALQNQSSKSKTLLELSSMQSIIGRGSACIVDA